MTSPVRGSWNLHGAVQRQWRAYNLDDVFKTAWAASKRADFLALSFDDVRGGPPPMPYCVVEIATAVRVNSTGGVTAGTEICTFNAAVQFTIHGESKEGLLPFIKAVAEAYAPDKPLNLSPDKHVMTWLVNDFGLKSDDQRYQWVLEYQVQFEGTYDLPAA